MNQKNLSSFQKYPFFSSRDRLFSLARVINGALLFGSEVGFIFSLALVLGSYGILSVKEVSSFSSWSLTQKISILCALLFCRGIFGWVDSVLARWGNEMFRSRVREGLVRWVLSQKSLDQSAFFGRFFSEADASMQAMSDMQIFSRVTIKLVVLFGVQVYIAPELSLVIFLGILLAGYPVHLIARISSLHARKQLATTQALNMTVIRNVKNLLLLRIHGMARSEFERVRGFLSEVSSGGVRVAAFEGAVSSYCHILTALLVLGVTWMGRAQLIFSPAMSILYFFAQYQFLLGLLNLYRMLPAFRARRDTLLKLKRWWEEQEFEVYPATPSSSQVSHFSSASALGWRWTDVKFGYAMGKPVFDGVSLEIRPGESVALCGPSGVGKTSFIHLLLGDVVPSGGKIEAFSSTKSCLVEKCREEILSSISYVGATSFLIPGTLYENLTYGLNKEVRSEDIESSLRAAACDFISELPGGLQYVLDDHYQGLSSGQKQRLCIARALLRKPKALLLDEVTAHLDEATEMKLVEGLKSLKGKVTLVCATHRSALIPAMDRKITLPIASRPATTASKRMAQNEGHFPSTKE